MKVVARLARFIGCMKGVAFNVLAGNYVILYVYVCLVRPARPITPLPFYMLRFICEGEGSSNSC